MKQLFSVVVCCLSLFGCSTTNTTELTYGSGFTLQINTEKLSEAKIFTADGLSIKFNSNDLLTGIMVFRSKENLPPSFDMRQLPDYLFNAKTADDEAISNQIDKTRMSLGIIAIGADVTPIRFDNKTIYTHCNDDGCIAFVTDKETDDRLLFLDGYGFKRSDFNTLLKGI